MKISFIIFCIVFYIFNLSGQQLNHEQKYLKNNDIIWAIENTKDYVLDDYKKAGESEINRVYTLKKIGMKAWLSDELSLSLCEMITEAVFNKQIKIYSDSSLAHEVDTSFIKDSDIYTKPNGISKDINPATINFDSLYEYRLRYIVYYDNKKANWNTEILGMAPLYRIYDKAGNILAKKELFWMKVHSGKANLNSKNIIWAKRISDRNQLIYTWSNRFHNLIPPIKVIKNSTDNHVSNFIDRIEKNSSIEIYNFGEPYVQNEKVLISPKQRQELLYNIDTIQLNGQAYIVKNTLYAYDLRELRLVHNWYWDTKRKKLSIWLERVGLMVNETDELGNFMYVKPYFYRYNED